jgi:hypothetical protein
VTSPNRVVLKDAELGADFEGAMEFRLTYDGPLLAQQRDERRGDSEPRAANKHFMRQTFHRQLRRLWNSTPFLHTGERSGPGALLLSGDQSDSDPPEYDIETLSKRHALYGFNFVPLVSHDLDLMCSLDILFLRPDKPRVFWAGDIDNRLKVLFDALAIPVASEDYATKRSPTADEVPFFSLLEDDKLITKIAVETDQLLDFDGSKARMNEVKLTITVKIRPYELTLGNMQFG